MCANVLHLVRVLARVCIARRLCAHVLVLVLVFVFVFVFVAVAVHVLVAAVPTRRGFVFSWNSATLRQRCGQRRVAY